MYQEYALKALAAALSTYALIPESPEAAQAVDEYCVGLPVDLPGRDAVASVVALCLDEDGERFVPVAQALVAAMLEGF